MSARTQKKRGMDVSDKKFVTYEEFGAKGDGVAEDFAAICRAHDYANENGLPIKAKDGATYYINSPIVDGEIKEAIIKTDVDWGNAKFIIDDRDISADNETNAWRSKVIFKVLPEHDMYKIEDEETLSQIVSAGLGTKTAKVNIKLDYPAMIIPYNSHRLVFKRLGYGSWNGASQHELIVIDKDGNVSPETPIMFDYNGLDYIEVVRLDEKPLTISGGEFTTLANRENTIRWQEDGSFKLVGGYISRGLNIRRSYTTVRGVKHFIKGEVALWEQVNEKGEIIHVSACYNGFYLASYGDHITFEDCIISGRRCYTRPKGGTGGTYGLSGNCVNKIVFKNCHQANFWVTVDENYDIHPAKEGDPGAITSMSGYEVNGTLLMMHWGIGGTNFCKNMEYIDCTLSRYDAHQGLYHGKIINTTLNGMEIVGNGNLLLENSRLFSRRGGRDAGAGNAIFYLRNDYASTWDGELTIKNFEVYASLDEDHRAFIFSHSYNNWDFGYQAYFPNLSVENLRYFDRETREPMPKGTNIYFVGSSIVREPNLHLKKTAKIPAIFPDVDEDGDGFVDGTKIPYDDVVSVRGVVDPDCMDNHNPIMPPKYIKILGNTDAGYNFIVHDTSEYEDGGFFGTTEFTSDLGSFTGTKNDSDNTFKFEKIEF